MHLKLFFFLLGCRPQGRLTEQHDVFFGIGATIADIIPSIKSFWKEAEGKIHVDAWREVNFVDGYQINVVPRLETKVESSEKKLFFLNLGGYKPGDFEEYHYKLLCVATDKSEAISIAKRTAFFKHTGFEGAGSHIDDKYGIDVDDVYEIKDILPDVMKEAYMLVITKQKHEAVNDELRIGYLNLSKSTFNP